MGLTTVECIVGSVYNQGEYCPLKIPRLQDSLAPMKKLGPYEFEGTLGRGGMGTVFRGRHRDTGELHAVKVLSPFYCNDDHFRGRFESEIQALLKLDHPNIVKLISYGQEDGNLFFSMELIEGNSLFQMQKKGHRFNWRECLQVAKDVCQGLRHAHDRGIIHRDLKPGNLLMTDFNSVKITDFGIAKSFGSSQNTGENIVGTMDFMSPEQAKGETVTFRSDLYSLGAVLYTLMSGRPPFSANSIEESLRNLTRVPAPRIGNAVPNVPEEMENLIAKLMEKKPERRIATALALSHQLADIETALKGHSEAKTAETGRKSNIDKESHTQRLDRDMATVAHFEDDSTSSKKRDSMPPEHPTRADKTVAEESPLPVGKPPKKLKVGRPDFYNRVGQADREVVLSNDDDPIESQYGKGILPTLLMLLGVVALGTFLFTRSQKIPSADQLYTEIQSSRPQSVLVQTESFMTSYPDDERIATVRRIHEFGKATKYYSQLSKRLEARSRLTGPELLTEIERQFMEIADLAKANFEAANIRMDAFVRVHDPNPDLSNRDRDCVDAAKSFRLKIREDAIKQAKTNLKSIRYALKSAAESDTTEAAAIYGSIIELYDSMSKATNPEVRKFVEEAKQRLAKIKSGETPPREKQPEPEPPSTTTPSSEDSSDDE